MSVVIVSKAVAHAMLLSQEGRFPEAISLAEEALRNARSRQGQETATTALAEMGVAGLYQGMGRFDEASVLLLHILPILKRELPEESPLVFAATAAEANARATLLCQRGNFVDAISLAEETLHNSRLRLGQDNSIAYQTLVTLGWLHYAQMQFKEASRYFSDALVLIKKLAPEDSLAVAQVEIHEANARAMGMFQEGKLADAIATEEEALRSSRSLPGSENLILAQSLGNLAMLYHAGGRDSEAEPLMRKKSEYEHPYYWAGYTITGAGAAELQ